MTVTTKPLTLGLLGIQIPLSPRALARGLINEVRSMPVALQAWFGLLFAILAVFVLAAVVAIPPGWEVFGTSPSFEWGMMIIGYVFFAIMTSGLCLAASLGTVFGIQRFRPFEKRHAVLALLSLTTAFLIIALDLHYPIRMVFGAVFVPSPESPMWWMGVFYGLYLVVLIVEVWTLFTPHPKIHLIACTACAITAVCAPTTLGLVFGYVGAKAFWAGIWTPIQMIATAVLLGTAVLGIVFYLVHRLRLADWQTAASVALPSVRILMLIAIAVAGALLVRQAVVGLDGDVRGLREATLAWITGPLALGFWGRVMIGLVIPAILLILPLSKKPEMTFAIAIMILVGVFLDRYIFVLAGQIYPMTAQSGIVSHPYAQYSPTVVEMAIIAGGFAFMALMYTLAERYLDMGHSGEHIFWPWPWIKDRDIHDAQDFDHVGGPHDHGHREHVEDEAPALEPAAVVAAPVADGAPRLEPAAVVAAPVADQEPRLEPAAVVAPAAGEAPAPVIDPAVAEVVAADEAPAPVIDPAVAEVVAADEAPAPVIDPAVAPVPAQVPAGAER